MTKTRNQKILLFITLLALPALTFAADSTVSTTVTGGLVQFGAIINALTSNVIRAISTLFATLAMVAFFYGIVQYIWGIREGDEGRVAKGNVFLRWGLVALFVMFSVWGIVIYVQRIFGIETNNTIIIPQIQLGGSASTSNSNPLAPPTGVGSPTGTGGATAGASCSTNGSTAECGSSGLVCTNYTCQQPGSSGGTQTVYTCSDGVTKYYDQSDAKFCPQSNGDSNGGTVNCSGITNETARVTCLRNTPCPDTREIRDDTGACVSGNNN